MKQVVILSGLLAAAMVGSYVTWTAEDPEASTEGAAVYTASEGDLQKVVWKSEKADIELSKRTDAAGDHVWIVATERKEVKIQPLPEGHPPIAEKEPAEDAPATDAAPDAAEGEEEPKEPETKIEETVASFVGNTSATDIWSAFAPLKAKRELGPTAGMDLSALGFDEPSATLVVHRGSGPLELVVGGEAYGSKDRYVKAGDTLYLVDDATLRPIEHASSRLIERALQPLAEKDIDKITVTDAQGKAVELVHQNPDDRAKAFWSRADAPDTAHESAGTWLGKLFRMRVNTYVEESSVTAPLETVFTFAVTGDDKTWNVEVVRELGDPQKGEYYARSSYNRSLVKLTRSLAADAAADLDAVFGE